MIKKLHKSGVTAAAGVQAAGIHAGFKKRKKDMALLYFPDGATVAGVFTKNKVKAAPVQYDQQVLQQHNAVIGAVSAKPTMPKSRSTTRQMFLQRKSGNMHDRAPRLVSRSFECLS